MKHGLHFNKFGKVQLANQLASIVQLMFGKKTDPPMTCHQSLILDYVSGESSDDLLCLCTFYYVMWNNILGQPDS
jgi:hypothetical protein